MTIQSDIQKLDPGAIVTLFELDATALAAATIYYFHAGVNELKQSVVWNGDTYTPFPIEADGFEKAGTGTSTRPTLRIANVTSLIGALVRDSNDLVGAKITRRRTFVRYLDAVNFTGGTNPTADPNIALPDEIYYIARKSSENKVYIEFELESALDMEGVMVPRGQVVQNICQWVYRSTECSYAGGAVANALDIATTVLAEDVCGKRISSCKLRFGASAEIPLGAFPGAGTYRG